MAGSRAVILVGAGFLLSSIGVAQDWSKESKDRTRRTALHDASQLVRGDSGKWSDEARLQYAPAVTQKPAKVTLDAWADQLIKKKVELTDKDESWLIFRTDQLDDNDRVWVERMERRGHRIIVTANLAKWQGKYFRNFTYHQFLAVNLGKLEAGAYEARWVLQPLVFSKFDGDGKAIEMNWPKDERPTTSKPVELRLTWTVKKGR